MQSWVSSVFAVRSAVKLVVYGTLCTWISLSALSLLCFDFLEVESGISCSLSLSAPLLSLWPCRPLGSFDDDAVYYFFSFTQILEEKGKTLSILVKDRKKKRRESSLQSFPASEYIFQHSLYLQAILFLFQYHFITITDLPVFSCCIFLSFRHVDFRLLYHLAVASSSDERLQVPLSPDDLRYRGSWFGEHQVQLRQPDSLSYRWFH